MFLAHWDNKADNQRLVCQAPFDPEKGETCAQPFLLLQDVGSTFGPSKVDLDAWKKSPIWEDRATCLTSMQELPYDGATYGEARISEEGRRFLADMLAKLSDRQLTDLFTSSRFDDELGLLRRTLPDCGLGDRVQGTGAADRGGAALSVDDVGVRTRRKSRADRAHRSRRFLPCARSPGTTAPRARSPPA